MDDVVAEFVLGHVRIHAGGEFVEPVVDLHLRDVAHRAGGDVDDARARGDLLDDRVIVLPLPRVHVDLDAAMRELARELADVQVHAPGVAAAELRHRARVDRQHRDAHQARSASSRASQRSVAPRSYLYGSSPRSRS